MEQMTPNGCRRLLLSLSLICSVCHSVGMQVSNICTLSSSRPLECIGIQDHGDFPLVLPYNLNVTSAVFVGTEHLLNFPNYPFEHTSWQDLQKLTLKNFNRIEFLDENSFMGLWNLKELSITNFTSLRKIDHSALLFLPKLEHLDLSFNVNLSLYSVEELIENTVPNLMRLFLSRLNNAADKPYILGKSFVSAIGTKKVTHLDLSGANISLIQPNVMESLFLNLHYLNLSDTGILWMDTNLAWLPNLQTIDITRTRYGYKKQTICHTEKFTNQSKSLKRIYASAMIFNDLDINDCSVSIEFDGGIPLEVLIIKHFRPNKTGDNVKFNGLFHNMSILDLSEGNISYLSQSMFQKFPSLKIANLSGNMLGKMEDTAEFVTLFNDNPQLQHVSLANNEIYKLPEDIFKNNAVLLTIDLHGNHLRNFNINLTRQLNFRYLDLSENNLRNISKSLIDVLERHFENQSVQSLDVFTCKNLSNVETDFNEDRCQELLIPQNLTLNLAGNPFECSCDNVYLMEWILNTKIDLVSKHNLKCSFMGNNLTMCAESLQYMKSMCKGSSTSITITIIAITVSLILLAILLVLVFVKKKVIKRYCVRCSSAEESNPDDYHATEELVEQNSDSENSLLSV